MDIDKYKINALKNNTFNLDDVELSLEESEMSSYDYLRQFQLDSTNYKRFDFKMQDIYRTNKINHVWSFVPRRWLFYIDCEFINVGKRLEYKRSKFYEKELSYDIITQNPTLFDLSFLVFIDGRLYTEGINILCKEDKTYVVFTCNESPVDKGFSIKEIRDYIENNVDVSIIFLPNVGITNIKSNAYRLKDNNKKNGTLYRTLNLSEHAKYDDTTLTFIKNDNNSSDFIAVTFGENGVFVNEEPLDDIIKTRPNNTTVDIQIVPLRYLLEKTIIEDSKWFSLPIQDYPVSINNCLVFDEDGLFVHQAKLKHYYPNVYSIENVDDIIGNKQLTVYSFYYPNRQGTLKHLNMFEVYHKYVPNYLEKYKNGTIPEIILNFEPEKVEYSIKDFKESGVEDDFVYKVEKMREFIAADVNNFRRYLVNLNLRNNYYYVDVSKIDLSSRLRTNNSDVGGNIIEFDEEMYMFVFRNDFRGKYDKLLIHIDGLRYETLNLFGNSNYDFLYVPCSLITNESTIEIEKMNEVIREYDFIGSAGVVEIDIGELAVRNKTLYNDLFLIDAETMDYIDTSKYRIVFPFDKDYEYMMSESRIDYIMSDDGVKYYIDEVDPNKVKFIEPEDEDEDDVTGELITNDLAEQSLYKLHINADDVNFEETNGAVITKYMQDQDDENIFYRFNVINGKVTIDVIDNNVKNENLALSYSNRQATRDEIPDVIELNDVFLPCERRIKIIILDKEYYGKKLQLHIKKNFRTIYSQISDASEDLKHIECQAAFKNDGRYVRVYRNGRLVPRHLVTTRFPKECKYGHLEVYPGVLREVGDIITVELMPYMMNQVCYMKTIPSDQIIDLTGMIDKPFDFKWHDIYINGRKLVKKEVEIISANKIKILGSNSLRWLEIIENSRDKEYFGYKPLIDIIDEMFEVDEEFKEVVNDSVEDMFDTEEPVVDIPVTMIDYLLRRFYDKYLLVNFGLINPDILQIDREVIEYYPEIFDINSNYFPLTPEVGAIGAKVILPINPDDE